MQDNVILPFTAVIAHISVFLIELFDSGVISAGKVISRYRQRVRDQYRTGL